MMKPTGLLVATGVLLVLSGTVWYFNKHPKKAEPLPESPKILALGEDQIQGLRIVKPGADPIVLKNLAGSWTIAEPKAMPADQDAVKSLVTSSAALTADRLIDDHPASLTDFGLANPALEVDVNVKGGTVDKVFFGSDNPSGSYAYAKLESKPAVYLVPSATKSTFDKTVNDLRDKRLLPFNQDKLTAVSVTSKGPAFEFGKNGQSEWQIVKPKPMRADTSQVDDLVRKLSDAKMDLTDDKAAVEFPKADKVASASVTDNSGTQTIEIRQAKDKTYYAKSTAVEGLYKLSGDLGDAVKDKDVDTFRNKKLFDFGFNDPTKVEINGTAYQKTAEKWNGPAGQIDSNSIQSVIDKLRDLTASKFSEKMGGSQVLALSVTSGDNHKIEKVVIGKAGDEYQAQREGEPAIYVIDPTAFDDLQKQISGIKPAAKPAAKK
ncbi:MAG: DUF4340 domain-containing protein [Bryobacteraceae bacterium]|jgi:hypothetical protein